MFGLTPYHHNELRFDPFAEMEELERSFFGRPSVSAFRTDVKDTGNAFVIEADLPGFKKEDVKIDLENGCLTITAERKSASDEKDSEGNYIRRERSFGSFTRSFDVTAIDENGIKAAFSDGVLTLTLPKLETKAPEVKRIEIE